MNENEKTSISKFLSLVLRHRPEAAGIALDEGGWTNVDTLLQGCHAHGKRFTREQLDEVVATNPKQRFAFSEDGSRIRANQGHSLEVELGYETAEPPDELFHGTVKQFLQSIRENGLVPMNRHHVHLSADESTARTVGSRRGKPIILRVAARQMRSAGHIFYCTPNGVWLTSQVPPQFLSGLDPD